MDFNWKDRRFGMRIQAEAAACVNILYELGFWCDDRIWQRVLYGSVGGDRVLTVC